MIKRSFIFILKLKCKREIAAPQPRKRGASSVPELDFIWGNIQERIEKDVFVFRPHPMRATFQASIFLHRYNLAGKNFLFKCKSYVITRSYSFCRVFLNLLIQRQLVLDFSYWVFSPFDKALQQGSPDFLSTAKVHFLLLVRQCFINWFRSIFLVGVSSGVRFVDSSHAFWPVPIHPEMSKKKL